MQNTYTHTHLKWKHGNLVAPENPCKFQSFSCILQCTLCPTFMITTPEVHTSLLSLVPINTLFIIRDFGSGKYSNACMYVCVCVCVCKSHIKRLGNSKPSKPTWPSYFITVPRATKASKGIKCSKKMSGERRNKFDNTNKRKDNISDNRINKKC